MEEMLAYKDFTDAQDENSRAYHGKRLIELVDAYERTGDLAMAKVTSINKMIANKEIDPTRGPVITEEVVTPVKIGSVVVLSRQTKTIDSSRKTLDGKPTVTLGEAEFSIMGDDDLTGGGSLISDSDLLSATRQTFDIQQFFQNNVTTEGQDRIIQRLESNTNPDGTANPLSFGDLTTTAKYKAVTDIVFDVIRGDITDETGARVSPNLLKDDEATKIKVALIQQLVGVEMWANYGEVSAMESNSPEKNTILRQIMDDLANIIYESGRVTGTLPALDRGQP